MKKIVDELFLYESYRESENMLSDAISGKRSAFWDNVVITTATNDQAMLYRRLLYDRILDRSIPSSCKYHTVPDREEKRIGSGGSTLYVLAKLYEASGSNIERLLSEKTLVLHSGGDARRLPHSAPLGKLFSLSGKPLRGDVRNPPGTLFDDIMVSLSGLPSRMNGGVLIVSADALFRFNHTQIDLSLPDAVAFAVKASVAEGCEHGVFLEKQSAGYVDSFLHKQSEETLRQAGAGSEFDSVDLDIGITYLGENAIRAMLGLLQDKSGAVSERLLQKYISDRVRLSFYGDIIYPMARESTLDEFMAQPGDGQTTRELLDLRPALFEALHGVSLRICRFSPGKIRNMGTTAETHETLRFFREEGRLAQDGNVSAALAERIALAAYISPRAVVSDNCFIENSIIGDGAEVGAGCLVSGCDLPGGFKLPPNVSLHSVKLKNGKWVCRFWGMADNIKSPEGWLGGKYSLTALCVQADSLWNAKLFPVCDSIEDALRWAVKFISGPLSADELNTWRSLTRHALSDTADMDAGELLAHRASAEDGVRIQTFVGEVLSGSPADEALVYLGHGDAAARRIKLLSDSIESGRYHDWRDNMRLCLCCAEAAERLDLDLDWEALRERGYAALRSAAVEHMRSGQGSDSSSESDIKWALPYAEVSLPIRVNWGGTWSDAPPYCFEKGGTMINAAVMMDGKLPICARAEVTKELCVEFVSVDLNVRKRFEDITPLSYFQDPTDTFILFKAALSVSGIIAPDRGELKEQLARLGGGVRITTDVDVPKGSGLGTSSIITGALIKVLTLLTGRERSNDEYSESVLQAEQLMTTGGGWQDAIGGMYPGVKLTLTEPGIPQRYQVQTIALPGNVESELNRRGFLVYTGQRRLARSVLRRVLSGYVCNRRESLSALTETQRLAVTMAYELKRGNVSQFGRLLSEHMRLLRTLDASSSNLMLDYMMEGLGEYIEGVTLCGAAGGGFMYGIAKPGFSLEDIARQLRLDYGGLSVRLYSATLYTHE